ncbi:hypothetical protein C8J56DRAFT_944717 [Mycena floridula]|nr:hypothetical protein C8J56DRAFT_944717 [Mycena floridula]
MSSLSHCFSESVIIIAVAVLIQPSTHFPGRPPVPNFDQCFHIPLLTIAHSALLIFTLIHRGCQRQPYNHRNTHLQLCRLDFPPPQSLRWSSCEASFQGRSC